MFELVFYGILAGLSLAVVSGPLGCFVVWRRMSYFGDTMAHSALLGITLAVLLEVNMTLMVVCVSVFIAVLLTFFMKSRHFASDTLLGILAHSSLALGLVTLSFMTEVRVDLNGFLFGDLLAVGPEALFWVMSASGLGLAAILGLWRQLLMMTVDEDLAKVEGIDVEQIKFFLLLILSLFIAVAIKIVGVLLVTSMLIIPAASARKLAHTPESMAAVASGLGCLMVLMGFGLSFYLDTPVGPSVVSCGFILFLIIYMTKKEQFRG